MKKYTNPEELETYLTTCNRAYRDGNELISDHEYDALEAQLIKLNPNAELLQNMRDDVYLDEKKLSIHMGSQNKALTLDDVKLTTFIKNTEHTGPYSWSLKCDGLSLELTYTYGSFTQGLTRGDGEHGVEVTSTLAKVSTIPATIPNTKKYTIVRGELMLTKSNLVELNRLRTEVGEEIFKNTRNGAVGILKAEKNRKYAHLLSFKAFDFKETETL